MFGNAQDGVVSAEARPACDSAVRQQGRHHPGDGFAQVTCLYYGAGRSGDDKPREPRIDSGKIISEILGGDFMLKQFSAAFLCTMLAVPALAQGTSIKK